MSAYVKVEWDRKSQMYVVSDEDGEFARANTHGGAVTYVGDLIIGPGTLHDGGLAERTENA